MTRQLRLATAEPEFAWAEPPKARINQNTERYERLAAQLKTAPGIWAIEGSYKVRSTCDSHSAAIRQNRVKPLRDTPEGVFESKSRKIGDDYMCFVRWVPASAE